MMDADLAFYRALYDQEQLRVAAAPLVKFMREHGRPIPSFESWLALRCRAAETRVEQLEQALEPVVALMNGEG